MNLYAFSQEANTGTGYFDGLVVGINTGVQNVFGGSLINGEDILAQEHKWVHEIELGYRRSFLQNKVVVGLEGFLGFLNGELNHTNQDQTLVINYSTYKQYSIGLFSGVILGKNNALLLFIYANETKRKFDVEIFEDPFNYEQTDKQGMLKYGIGIEYKMLSKLHLRAKAASMRVDFGDRVTNIDVEDKNDYIIGILYKF